jgi:hypothetical protein
MRHINEAEWCRKEGFYLVRIVGPCRAEGERRDPTHASEVHVDELEVDGSRQHGNLEHTEGTSLGPAVATSRNAPTPVFI